MAPVLSLSIGLCGGEREKQLQGSSSSWFWLAGYVFVGDLRNRNFFISRVVRLLVLTAAFAEDGAQGTSRTRRVTDHDRRRIRTAGEGRTNINH